MEDYNKDYNLNGLIIPANIIDKIIRSDNNGRIVELCLFWYEGRDFCRSNNINYISSCGWICINV